MTTFEIGARVECGELYIEDYDAGNVLETRKLNRGWQCLVGWDSGCKTWCDAADLMPEGDAQTREDER